MTPESFSILQKFSRAAISSPWGNSVPSCLLVVLSFPVWFCGTLLAFHNVPAQSTDLSGQPLSGISPFMFCLCFLLPQLSAPWSPSLSLSLSPFHFIMNLLGPLFSVLFGSMLNLPRHFLHLMLPTASVNLPSIISRMTLDQRVGERGLLSFWVAKPAESLLFFSGPWFHFPQVSKSC